MDIVMDKYLLDNYTLCLTKDQLEINDDILPTESAIFPRLNGVATISESFALNLIISIPL